MKFCSDHWQQLRDAIDASGLFALIAESGEQAARNLASEVTEGSTVDNFDPLMWAHNFIWSGAMQSIKEEYQQNPLMLMADESDPAVTWPTCPICALNWCHAEHDRLCTQEGCNYPKGYDWSTDTFRIAAERAVEHWRSLGPGSATNTASSGDDHE